MPNTPPFSPRATAVFAGGCFWCVEAVFEELDGVIDAISGYTGGAKETANYEAVCSGTTNHAEAVQIVYDPSRIGYRKLLEVHFATHDPTTLNRQGNDVGSQYRSAVFYTTQRQKEMTKLAKMVKDYNNDPDRVLATRLTRGEKALVTVLTGPFAVIPIGITSATSRGIERAQEKGRYDKKLNKELATIAKQDAKAAKTSKR